MLSVNELRSLQVDCNGCRDTGKKRRARALERKSANFRNSMQR